MNKSTIESSLIAEKINDGTRFTLHIHGDNEVESSTKFMILKEDDQGFSFLVKSNEAGVQEVFFSRTDIKGNEYKQKIASLENIEEKQAKEFAKKLSNDAFTQFSEAAGLLSKSYKDDVTSKLDHAINDDVSVSYWFKLMTIPVVLFIVFYIIKMVFLTPYEAPNQMPLAPIPEIPGIINLEQPYIDQQLFEQSNLTTIPPNNQQRNTQEPFITKEDMQLQLEITRQALRDMGIDPGQATDTGCFSPQ